MEKLKSLGKGKLLRIGLQVVILLGLVIATAKYVNGQELLSAVTSARFRWIPFILLIVTAHLALKAWRFVLLMEPFSADVPRLVTFKAYVAGQAATLVPGGVAARAGLMKQVNVSVAQSSAPVAFSNGLDQVVFIVGSLVASFWFRPLRTPILILIGILTVVILLFLLPGMRKWLAGAADWAAKKLDKRDEWHTFLDAVPKVLAPPIVLLSAGLTLLAFIGKVVALDLSMHSMGLDLGYPALFLGYVIPTLLGRLVPIPGGLGVTEASMISFLSAITPAGTYPLTIGVVIFRISSIFFLALVGAVVYYGMWDGAEESKAKSTF